MSITTRARRGLATAVAAVLTTGGVVALASAPAQAAPKSVSNVELTWGLSNEQGGGAFFGGCNFLSAGTAGNTGSSRLWTEADGFYKTVDGNVAIEKPTSSGAYAVPSWSTKCQTPAGTNVSPGSTSSLTGNRVKLSAGTGTIDPATGAGTISWTGSFTSVFYGGLTYWSATNPTLQIEADGTGTLTATASGYGADMDEPGQWNTLTPRTITLAQFTDVNIGELGFTATPTYLGTTVTTSGTPQPAKTTANEAYWGSFPQSFVDFQQETGQSSYWYTSGGSRDAAKPATPVAVRIGPKVTVSTTSFLSDGSQTVTVTGSGFDPSIATGTRPPLAGRPAGVYIAVGKFAETWRPSTGAASTSRKTMTSAQGGLKWAVLETDQAAIGGTSGGAVTLTPEGTFSTTLTVNKAQLDAIATDPSLVNYGIYTYPGSGGVQAAYETYTPITFAATPPVVEAPVVTPPAVQPVAPSKVSVKRGSTTKPTTKKTGRTTVTVTAANGAPVTGRVTVSFTKKGRKTKTKTATVKSGRATLTVPKLAKGTWKVSVKYLGTTAFKRTATLQRGSFTVTR